MSSTTRSIPIFLIVIIILTLLQIVQFRIVHEDNERITRNQAVIIQNQGKIMHSQDVLISMHPELFCNDY